MARWRLPAIEIAAVLLSCLLAIWFQRQAQAHATCCDAAGYWRLARAYLEHGWMVEDRAAPYRLYLFPTLLAGVDRVATWLRVDPGSLLFAAQLGAYLATCRLLAAQLFAGRPARVTLAFALLACNVVVLPYLSLSLADAAALVAFQGWLACVVALHRNHPDAPDPRLRRFAVAAALAGMAMAIRPAYIWLLPITLAMAIWLPPRDRRVGRMLLALCLPALLLAPQVAINARMFGTYSPLPAADLGDLQVRWGIENLKYTTAPLPGRDWQVFYPNPFVAGTLRPDEPAGVDWYVRHPLRAAATVSSKLVGAFDVDYLAPYVHDPAARSPWVLRLGTLSVLLLGGIGVVLHALRRRAGGSLATAWRRDGASVGPAWLPALLVAGWGAVTLLTALELRFALPMYALLLPLALGTLGCWWAAPIRGRAAWLIIGAGALAGLAWVAAFVASQANFT